MVEVAVSVLSVEPENAVSVFYNLETAKINYFHIDVMDGKFVKNNNIDVMKDYALTLSHITNIGLDVHLMVEDVQKFVEDFALFNPKIITFHYEAIQDKSKIMRIIKNIKDSGIQVGIAINPETPISSIYEFLPYIHQVIVMTVVPGKGGQDLIPETIEKIKELKKYISDNNLELNIEADGGIKDINSQSICDAGADILVSGSYITNADNYLESVKKLKGEIK